MKTIPYGKQWIGKDDIKAVEKVLRSNFITQGPKIQEFEKALAKKVGAKYALVFNSGTAALQASYFALGLGKDDEFITTPNTFAATANAGVYLGAKPVFVDIEKNTGNIDISKIKKQISKRTKLIAPVDYGGYPANLKEIQKLARKHKLFVVEDSSHALGAKYKGEKIGNCKFSDISIFSFHPVKHITLAEGGAITTNNKSFYQKMFAFRTHGFIKGRMHYLGYNFRITDIQAALGFSQLKKLDFFVKRRREIAKIYNRKFKNNPYFDFLEEEDKIQSSYHLYPIRLKDKYKNKKDKIVAVLKRNGLGVQIHYIPVYLHPYYQKLGYKKGLCPNAEDFYKREISIPMYPRMTDKEVDYVVKIILKVLKILE